MPLKIAAWNIQRVNNFRTNNPDLSQRVWLVMVKVADLFVNQGYHIVFLSEVTHRNAEFMTTLNGMVSQNNIILGMLPIFNKGPSGKISPCSALLLYRSVGLGAIDQPKITQRGDLTRLIVEVNVMGKNFVFVHLIANAKKSLGELADICSHVKNSGNWLIAGDLNFDYDTLVVEQAKNFSNFSLELEEIKDAGFDAIEPAQGVTHTHCSSGSFPPKYKILDYAWSNYLGVQPLDPSPDHDYTSMPDHRPIGYEVP